MVVDFSQFAGKTLILYNDAPAAFPARVAGYDYYTGGPDLTPGGAPTHPARLRARTPAPSCRSRCARQPPRRPAFTPDRSSSGRVRTTTPTAPGVFESSQHPIIVGQAALQPRLRHQLRGSGDCTSPTRTAKCDGFARINQQGGDLFTFNTLSAATQLAMQMQPKAHPRRDELGDLRRVRADDGQPRPRGRPGAHAGAQNIILYPYVNPATEIIDGTNLPAAATSTPDLPRPRTGPRSGRSPTTAWTPTRSTSTSSTSRCSTG